MSDNLGSIGEVFVDVGLDWSDIDSALGQVEARVNTSSEDIRAALNSWETSSELPSKLDEIGNSIQGAGDAANNATPKLEEFGQGAHDAGEKAGEANPLVEALTEKFQEFGKQLLEFGGGLLALEGIKTFLEETLTTFGQIEQFTVSMTQLTGSLESAKEVLEGIEHIAQTQPFSFPELLPAVQKLAAFGVQGETLTRVIQSAGDAAAATGNSFDAVSAALGRVELSGQVSARQLVQLGLSWNDLAKAMGTSVNQAQELLKKGGQDAAADLDVLLTAINQKFSGASQALANTLLGQWQILKNQIHGFFDQVGGELAPVAEAFMAAFTGTVLPLLKSLAASLGDLGGAVVQLLGTLQPIGQLLGAILVGAVQALTAGLEALSSGIRFVATNFGGFLTDLAQFAATGAVIVGTIAGLTAGMAALEPVIVAVTGAFLLLQTEGIAAVFTSLTGAVEGVIVQMGLMQDAAVLMTTTLGAMQVAALGVAAAFVGFEIGQWAYRNIPGVKALGDAFADLPIAIANFEQRVTDSENLLEQQTQKLEAALSKQGITVDRGTMSLQQYSLALNEAARAHQAVGGALDPLVGKINQTVAAFGAQQDVVNQARQNLQFLQQMYEAGGASAGQLADAQHKLDQAILAINPHYVTGAQAAQQLQAAQKELDSASQALAGSLAKQQPVLTDITTATVKDQEAQQGWKDSTVALQGAIAGLNTQIQSSHLNLTALQNAVADAKDAMQGMKLAADQANASHKALADTTKVYADIEKALAEGARDYANVITALHIPALKSQAQAQAEVAAAGQKVRDAELNEQLVLKDLADLKAQDVITDQEEKQLKSELAAAHDVVTAALKNLTSARKDAAESQKLSNELDKAIADAQRELQAAYSAEAGPLTNLAAGLDAVRAAKAAEWSATVALASSERDLRDARATSDPTTIQQALQNYTQAKKDHKLATDAVKQAEDAVAQSFGASKQALESIRPALDASTISAQNLQAALSALHVQSSQDLDATAQAAIQAFQIVQQAFENGQASGVQYQESAIAMYAALKAAALQHGSDLSATEQATYDKLLAQQDQYNRQHVDRWMELYRQVQQIGDQFSSQLSSTLFNTLFFNDTNAQLDQQTAQLQQSLADRTAAWQQYQQDVAAQMQQLQQKSAADLQNQLQSVQDGLAKQEQAYQDYVAQTAQQIADSRAKNAAAEQSEIASLNDALAQKEQSYDQFVQDTNAKLEQITQDHKEQLDQQVSQLQDSLAKQTEQYEYFVQDANTKLRRIGETEKEDVAHKSEQTKRSIEDKQKQYARDEQDTNEQIQRITAAHQSGWQQQVADLETALARKKQDTDTYIQRQEQDLQEYTQEHQEALQQQTDDLNTELQRRADAQAQAVADTKAKIQQVTDKNQEDLERQTAALQLELQRRSAALEQDKQTTEQKITAVTDKYKKAEADQEASLEASLAKKQSDLAQYEADAKKKQDDLTAAAAANLQAQEGALQKSLGAQLAQYDTFVKDTKTKLDDLKSKHVTIWGEIEDMLIGKTGIFTKIGEAFLTELIKPMADAIAHFIATSIADLLGKTGFGGLKDALSGLGNQLTKLFGGGGGSGIGSIDKTPAGIGGAGGAGGDSGGGGMVGAIIQSITQAIGAVADVINAIEGAHTNTLLSRVEESTRKSWIVMGEQGDSIWAETKLSEQHLALVNTQLDLLGEKLAYLEDIRDSINKLSGFGSADASQSAQPVNVSDFAALLADADGLKNIAQSILEGVTGPGGILEGLRNINNDCYYGTLGIKALLDLFQSGTVAVNGGSSGSTGTVTPGSGTTGAPATSPVAHPGPAGSGHPGTETGSRGSGRAGIGDTTATPQTVGPPVGGPVGAQLATDPGYYLPAANDKSPSGTYYTDPATGKVYLKEVNPLGRTAAQGGGVYEQQLPSSGVASDAGAIAQLGVTIKDALSSTTDKILGVLTDIKATVAQGFSLAVDTVTAAADRLFAITANVEEALRSISADSHDSSLGIQSLGRQFSQLLDVENSFMASVHADLVSLVSAVRSISAPPSTTQTSSVVSGYQPSPQVVTFSPNVTFSGPVYGGRSGLDEITSAVGNRMMDEFRRAGLKF